MAENKKYVMSHSRAETWLECPEKEHLRYVERVQAMEYGSSLAFGIAIDTAVSALLRAIKDGLPPITDLKKVFMEDKLKGWQLVLANANVRYGTNDFDSAVIQTQEDKDLITFWESTLNVKLSEALAAERQKKYKKMTEEELSLFNKAAWLSLKNKGYLMLEAFVREILPKIKKVIAVQHKFEGTIEDDKDAKGYIDFIVEFDGYDKPVVFDLKTSASPYDADDVFLSQQLHLYLSAVGAPLKTDLAGFIVLLKSMGGKTLCSKCGYQKEKGSRFKTCNFESNKVRCNAEWLELPEANVQILVGQIPVERQQQYLNSFSNLAVLASQGLRVQNWNSCKNYGLCEYFHLCHFGDKSKYIWPQKQSQEQEKGETK